MGMSLGNLLKIVGESVKNRFVVLQFVVKVVKVILEID